MVDLKVPWLFDDPRTTSQKEREKREKQRRQRSAEALSKQEYKPEKGLFSRAVSGLQDFGGDAASGVSDFVTEDIPDAATEAGKKAWGGLETYGEFTQGAVAVPFTQGKVEDGQYTTDFNLGNPLSNIKSHVEAQQETGKLPRSEDNFLDAIGSGFKGVQQAGQAYEEDPDVPAGVKFGTGVISDPLSYTGVGLAGKIPKIGGLLRGAGAGKKAARGGINLAEGFGTPAQVGGFAAGGGLATEAVTRNDIPFVPEPVEQLGAGLLGGIGGTSIVGRLRRARSLSQQMDGPVAEMVGRRDPEVDFLQETLNEMRKQESELDLDSIKDLRRQIEEKGGQDTGIPSRIELMDEMHDLIGEMDETQYEAYSTARQKGELQGIGDPLVDTALDLQGKIDNYSSFRQVREGMTTEEPLLSEIEESAEGLRERRGNVEERLLNIYREEDTSYRPDRAEEIRSLESELLEIDNQLQSAKGITSYEASAQGFQTDLSELDDTTLINRIEDAHARSSGARDPSASQSELMEWAGRLRNLEEEANRRGIDVPTEIDNRRSRRSLDSEEGSPPASPIDRERSFFESMDDENLQDQITDMENLLADDNLTQFGERNLELAREVQAQRVRARPPREEPTGLEGVSDEKLRSDMQRIEKLGLPETEKNILRRTYQREISRRGIGEAAGESDTVTLYHGSGRALDSLNPDSYLTDNPQTARTMARTNAQLEGGEPKVYEVQVPRSALRQVDPSESVEAARHNTYILSDPSRATLREAPSDIRGGRASESLAQARDPGEGLTVGQRITNLAVHARRAMTGNGILNDAVATPIAREYSRLHSTIVNQGEIVNRYAVELENSLQKPGAGRRATESRGQRTTLLYNINGTEIRPASIQDIAQNFSKYRNLLTNKQKDTFEALRRSIEDFKETLNEHGIEIEEPVQIKDQEGFYLPRVLTDSKGRPELQPQAIPKGGGSKSFEKERQWDTMARGILEGDEQYLGFNESISHYANDVANRVAETWLANRVQELAPKGKGRDGTGSVQLYQTTGMHNIELPSEISDVINREIGNIKGINRSEADQLYSDVNNTLRSVWATADASRVGIQSLQFAADNPARWAKTVATSQKTLGKPEILSEYIRRHDERVYGTDKPTVQEMTRNGMEITSATGAGTDIGGITGRIEQVPVAGQVLKKANRLFSESANLERINQFDMLYEQYMGGGIPFLTHIRKIPGATREEILQDIAQTVNRSTGHAERGFGGNIGQAIMFAPRFFQSQIETVIKAATPSSNIQNQVARRQLGKTVALGGAMTVAINEARGKETEYDPRNSNFMRIRDVGGADISVFGPWDSLARAFVRSSPRIEENGDFTIGDPSYILRTKLSPVLSTAVALTTGKTFMGEDIGFSNPDELEEVVRQLFVPFSFREAGREPNTILPLNFLGIKSSPLTNSEQVENMMRNDGIDPEDDDYLIKRREWLANNEDRIPESTYEEGQRSQEIRQSISERRDQNENVLEKGQISLPQFRENRSLLLREQRNRLDELLRDSERPEPDTKQGEWLNSYFQLFEEAADDITGDVNSAEFDKLVVRWEEENGLEAREFVEEYLGSGLGPIESQYYQDMQTLDEAGYFDAPKYQGMRSDLSEEEIDIWSSMIDQARLANPRLQDQPWSSTARAMLGDQLSRKEIQDILNSRKQAYQSDEVKRMKREYGRELLWFNPRATWDVYQNYEKRKGGGAAAGFDLDLNLNLDLNL